jgi:hypothetical protein
MASVRVFVDDAVQGRLPSLCVSSGAPADRRRRVAQRVGGPNPALLLLVLLGPPGWILLLLLSGRGERLDMLLPVSDAVARRWEQRTWHRRLAVGATALGGAVLFVAGPSPITLGLTAAAAIWAFAAHFLLLMDGIGIHLDASRRWVTLKGVDQAFAAAVRAEQAAAGH